MSTLKSNLRKIFLFKGSLGFALSILICLIFSAVLGGLIPPGIKKLAALYGKDNLYTDQIKVLGVLFFAIYLNRAFYQLAVNKFVKLLMNNVRNICYRKWLFFRKDWKIRDKFPMGELIARIVNDTEAIRELITSGSFGILIDLFFVVSCLISFIVLNTKAGVYIVTFEVLASVALIYGSKYMREIFMSVRESRGHLLKSLANVIGGLEEAYYNETHGYAQKKTVIWFNDFLRKQLRANSWDASYYSFAESLYPLMLLLVIVIFPYTGITEAALVFAIVDLIQRSIGPIKDISGKIANVQRAATGVIRIQEFLARLETSDTDVDSKDTQKVIKKFDQESYVEKLHVKINSFKYPAGKTKRHAFELGPLEFNCLKGQSVGVVGFSGCGKSTLLKILCANLEQQNGSIEFLDQENHSLYHFNEHNSDSFEQKRLIGLVSQDSHVFAQTLAFNLSFEEEVTPEFLEFWKMALKRVEYLKVWENSLEQVFEPGELSLGQKQLICGLRCCYLKKPVVLLDEISASLDSSLEKALRELIEFIQSTSITIVVAHRFETILQSDSIIMMEDGKVAAMGAHQELYESSKLYQDFLNELRG